MHDPGPGDDLAHPAALGGLPALPAQQPALSWLAEPPTRRRSAVLALLALPPVPDPDDAPPLPRRAPARPRPSVPGPRAPVLDRAWAHDRDTLQRILVGLRAL